MRKKIASEARGRGQRRMEVVRLEAAKAAFAAERYYIITPEKVPPNVASSPSADVP